MPETEDLKSKRTDLIQQLLKMDVDLSGFLDRYSALLDEKDRLLDEMKRYTVSPTSNN